MIVWERGARAGRLAGQAGANGERRAKAKGATMSTERTSEPDAAPSPPPEAGSESASGDGMGEGGRPEAPIPQGRGLPALAIVAFVLLVLGSMAVLIYFAITGGHAI